MNNPKHVNLCTNAKEFLLGYIFGDRVTRSNDNKHLKISNRQNHLLPLLSHQCGHDLSPSHQHWQAFFILTSLLVVWKKIFFYLSSIAKFWSHIEYLWLHIFHLFISRLYFFEFFSQASTWLCTLILISVLYLPGWKICCFLQTLCWPPFPASELESDPQPRTLGGKDLGWLPIAPRICVTGNFPNFSMPQIPHLKLRDSKIVYSKGLPSGLNGIVM